MLPPKKSLATARSSTSRARVGRHERAEHPGAVGAGQDRDGAAVGPRRAVGRRGAR